MTNTQRAAARLALITAAVMAGILNGSVLAAPVLIFMVYLLAVLVQQSQQAARIYYAEKHRGHVAQLADLRPENIPANWGGM